VQVAVIPQQLGTLLPDLGQYRFGALARAELSRRVGQDPLAAGQLVLGLRDLGHPPGDLVQERLV
jgi:hypothetical protein